MLVPRSSLWKWYFCGLLFMQMNCAQHKAVQLVANPMDAAWSKIRHGIDKLEEEHASEKEWRKASEPQPKVLGSAADLYDQTKGLKIASSENDDLSAAYYRSSRVIHFGFTCDYHALVFFDEAGKSWKVIKW